MRSGFQLKMNLSFAIRFYFLNLRENPWKKNQDRIYSQCSYVPDFWRWSVINNKEFSLKSTNKLNLISKREKD